MSRFFNFFQRLNQNGGGSPADSVPLDRQTKSEREVDYALSMLLSQEIPGGWQPPVGAQFSREEVTRGVSILDKPLRKTDLQSARSEDVNLRPESRLIVETAPRSAGADRFRLLRMRLRETRKSKDIRTILVTSALPAEGKSTVAANLATTLAKENKSPVLLIEADMHRATLAGMLGLQDGPGLAECLEDGMIPMKAMLRLNPLGWYLLPAGKARGNPTELLQGETFPAILQDLTPHFDWVVIDSPPIIPLSDAMCLCRHADTSLLVVKAGQTQKQEVEKAIELLGKQNMLGVLLNGLADLNDMYSKYSSYYGSAQALSS